MSGSADDPRPPVPPPPALPDVDSPPPEEVLDGVPSVDEIVEGAQPAAEIIGEQPNGDDLDDDER